MAIINQNENVENQYADHQNLSIRIALHKKYSTNPYGITNWMFDRYQFKANGKILELGCGTGSQWENRIKSLPAGSMLILSDFSMGMVETVQEKYGRNSCVVTERIDAQEIPFAENSMDTVIANHMLYHVPNLPKAVSEIYRVLKPGGRLYAATNGSGGMRTFLHETLKEFNPRIDAFNKVFPFHLQNGAGILKEWFQEVETELYQDSLKITETRDLVDWIYSCIGIEELEEAALDGIFDFYEKIRIKEGAIEIPKEVGMLIAVK